MRVSSSYSRWTVFRAGAVGERTMDNGHNESCGLCRRLFSSRRSLWPLHVGPEHPRRHSANDHQGAILRPTSGVPADHAQALRAEGLDPDDPAVVAAIDMVRWELS